MDRTNANNFRSNLKEWMEVARVEPIKITRKSGEAFVLMNSDLFERMQVELANFRGIAQGLSDVVHDRMHASTAKSLETVIDRAKERVFNKRSKKAIG